MQSALIIANGQACHPSLLESLLEKRPFIIVLDSAIQRVLDLNIPIDVLLGDFDKALDFENIQKKYPHIEIIHTPDQEKTDLQKGFDFLIERGFTFVNVLWATGKRADHTLTNITNVVRYKNKLKIVLLDNHSRIFLLENTFEHWYPKNTILSLIPIGTVTDVETQGLKYPLFKESLTLGYRTGISNETVENGIVKISHTNGDLLLMECWD